MIRVLSNQQIEGVEYCDWSEFESWLQFQKEYQFDIETDVTPYWSTKKVKTLQFGDVDNTIQYVLEWAILDDKQLEYIKRSLESWEIKKLIQYALFEYVVMRFHGMEIHNVYCTATIEKVINGGIEVMNYALSDLTERYLNISIDKSLQTSFGDGILTFDKVEYAATDTMYLGEIRKLQIEALMQWQNPLCLNPLNLIELEMDALLAFGDMMYYGVELNVDKWRENIGLAQPVIDNAKKALEDWVLKDERLKSKAIELKAFLTVDTPQYNLNSPAQKAKLLQCIFPDIAGSTQNVIKAYIRDNGPTLPLEKLNLLLGLQEKDYSLFEQVLLRDHRDFLIAENMLLPANSFNINWNSVPQVLPLFKAVEPKLKDLSEESLGKTTHPICLNLEEYKNSLKLVSSYGEAFIENQVEPDGMVRCTYNPIVSTGRSSSAFPNMQQIPSKEHLQNRYRESFKYKDWPWVGSDYKGQELACIAHIAQDDVWFEAIKNDLDLHSITAAMVFKEKWKAATEPGCIYEKEKQKCKCSGHKVLRSATKTINFG